MAALPSLFGALAVLCALDAAFVAALAAGRGVSGAGPICSAILACGAVCLIAAKVVS